MKDPKIIELRRRIGAEVTGNPDFIAADYAGLDPKDQIKITNLMKLEIRENPDSFSPQQVKIAQTDDIEEPTPFGVLEAAKSFGEGAKEGALSFGGDLKGLLTIAALASGAVAVIRLIDILGKGKK